MAEVLCVVNHLGTTISGTYFLGI